MFAKRIIGLLPSPTMMLDQRAKELRRQGIEIINLSAGEPDYDTPTTIKEAAIHAIEAGFTHYTQPEGIFELREAIADKFKKDNNISYDPSQIIVGAGSKQILYSAFQVLCDKHDEVLVPTPVYSSYIEQIKLAEGKPVTIKLKSPFKLTAAEVERAITPKTKILLLNTPASPTGAIIEKSELEKIAKLVIKHDLWVISDEIYEKIIYTGKHVSIASINKLVKEKTLTVNGVSKAFAMTGWRIGYAGGPKNVIRAMTTLQSQMTSNANSIAQMAALGSLKGGKSTREAMNKSYIKRRTFLLDALEDIPQLSFVAPEGTFYFFVSLEKVLGGKYKTAPEWCEALLKEEKVAVVPGEAFLYPGYFRLSFTKPTVTLVEAVKRIKRFVEKSS